MIGKVTCKSSGYDPGGPPINDPTLGPGAVPSAPEAVWAVVELMGHVKLAGRLTEEEKFGAKLGRLDIPTDDGFVTQFFGGGSVYRITLVTEDVARHVAKKSSPEPVHSWDFPKQLPASSHRTLPDDMPDEHYEDLAAE